MEDILAGFAMVLGVINVWITISIMVNKRAERDNKIIETKFNGIVLISNVWEKLLDIAGGLKPKTPQEKELAWRRRDLKDMERVKRNIEEMAEVERIEAEMFKERKPPKQVHLSTVSRDAHHISYAAAQTGMSLNELYSLPELKTSHSNKINNFGNEVSPYSMSGKDKCRIKFYRVQPGDTLNKIALLHGMDVLDIRKMNNLISPDKIKVGDEIVVYDRLFSVKQQIIESQHAPHISGQTNTFYNKEKAETITIDSAGNKFIHFHY